MLSHHAFGRVVREKNDVYRSEERKNIGSFRLKASNLESYRAYSIRCSKKNFFVLSMETEQLWAYGLSQYWQQQSVRPKFAHIKTQSNGIKIYRKKLAFGSIGCTLTAIIPAVFTPVNKDYQNSSY